MPTLTDVPDERFWAFVRLREAVRQLRELSDAGPPWTSDPVLRKYHFSNVFREHDTGTKWIRTWLANRPDLTDREVVWYCLVYRWLNNVKTSTKHGLPHGDDTTITQWLADVDALRSSGVSVGSPRHYTSFKRVKKDIFVARDVIANMPNNLLTTGEQLSNTLLTIPGVGTFFAVQVIADFVRHPTSQINVDTMIPLGVGAKIALHLLDTGQFIENGDHDASMRQPRTVTPQQLSTMHRLHDSIPNVHWMMTYIDLEHALCEWYKYECVAAGRPVKLRLYRG